MLMGRVWEVLQNIVDFQGHDPVNHILGHISITAVTIVTKFQHRIAWVGALNKINNILSGLNVRRTQTRYVCHYFTKRCL